MTYDAYDEEDCTGDSLRYYEYTVSDTGCVNGIDYVIDNTGLYVTYYISSDDCSGDPYGNRTVLVQSGCENGGVFESFEVSITQETTGTGGGGTSGVNSIKIVRIFPIADSNGLQV